MIFGKQIAAIRGAEGLSREEFANLSGMSVPGLQKIENGDSCTDRTRRKITRAVADLGYRFTETGIEQIDLVTEVLTGEDRLLTLLADIGTTECRINGADDSRTPPNIIQKVQEQRKQGLKMRHLICQGDTFIRGPLDEYRYVPKKFFTNQPRFIFGDSIAFLGDDKVVIIHDKDMAEAERRQFDMDFSMLPQPEMSICEDRYV